MEIKRETSFTKNVKCQDVYTESQADYVLPDYLGDVRKILFTEATLRPSGRFAGGDEVEFSGVVVYNVIYLDSENNLSSAEFTSDYDYTVKCSGENYKDSISDTRVSNYAIRLMGPRKFSARASLVGSVRLSETDSLTVEGDAFDDGGAEVNTKSVKMRRQMPSGVCEREYAESLARLDGVAKDEVRLIYSGAETEVDSVEAVDEAVRLRGRLCIKAVLCVADEPAYRLEKQINFDESLPFEGVSADMKLLPELTVSSLKCLVNADENGCEVVGSAILEASVLAETNETVDLTLDSYLKSCPTDNTYEDFSYQTLCDLSTVRGVHNAEVEKGDLECEGIEDIIFLSATPKVEQVDCSGDRVNIIGEIRYTGIASENNDDGISYVGFKFTSPFGTNVNISCQNNGKMQFETRVSASGANATMDSGRIYASCNLESCVTAVCEEKEKILASSVKREDEKYEKTGATITVYYPDEGDTLFSVAKKFRTSGLKIARDNDISEQVFAASNPEGVLRGIKKLLIY